MPTEHGSPSSSTGSRPACRRPGPHHAPPALLADAACERTSADMSTPRRYDQAFLDTARVSGQTVTGQAQAAGERVADHRPHRRQDRRRPGQAPRGQGRPNAASEAPPSSMRSTPSATVEDQVDDQPGSGTPYEQWTKAELVERARELDIEGRTGLNKSS